MPRQKQWRPLRWHGSHHLADFTGHYPRARPRNSSRGSSLKTRARRQSVVIRGAGLSTTKRPRSTLRWFSVLEVRLGPRPFRFARPRFIAPNRNKTCQGVYSRATSISISALFLPPLSFFPLPLFHFSSLFFATFCQSIRYYRMPKRRISSLSRGTIARTGFLQARETRDHMAALLKIIRVHYSRIILQKRNQIIISAKTTREKRLRLSAGLSARALSPLVLCTFWRTSFFHQTLKPRRNWITLPLRVLETAFSTSLALCLNSNRRAGWKFRGFLQREVRGKNYSINCNFFEMFSTS